MNVKNIFDISLLLNKDTVIYPDNPALEISQIKTAHSFLSKIIFGSHTGTHIDAPAHIDNSKNGIESFKMNQFIGECKVLDMTHCINSIKLLDIENISINKGDRILFKTSNSKRGYNSFYEDFVYVEAEVAKYLAKKEVLLCGIDYLSIKQKGQDDNSSHIYLLEKNIVILEGIDLSEVEPGDYFLNAMPLKFEGIDGAPCRAVLIEFGN